MTEERSGPPSGRPRWLLTSLTAKSTRLRVFTGVRSDTVAALGATAFLVLVLYSVSEKRFLFADGAYYFVRILEVQEIWQGSRPFSRYFANVVNQAPIVTALKLGVRDFDVLAYFQGFGLYLPYLICIGISLWATRQHKESRLFLVFFLFAGVTTTDFFIISQSHVASAFYFCLLVLMLYRSPWRWGTVILAAALAVILLRAYESMLVFGPLLALIALWRARIVQDWAVRLGWMTLAVGFLTGALIALSGVMHPTDYSDGQVSGFGSDSKDLVVRHMLAGLWGKRNLHYGGILALIGIGLVGSAFIRSPGAARYWRAGLVVYSIASLILILCMVAFPSLMEIKLHYKGRVLNTAVPALLGVAMFAVRVGFVRVTERGWRRASAATLVLVLFQSGWQVLATRQWAGYVDLFREQISERRGLVPVEETVISKRRIGNQLVAVMDWSWTTPFMSIVLAPHGQVRAIILGRGPSLQFDPKVAETYPDLSAYGVVYLHLDTFAPSGERDRPP